MQAKLGSAFIIALSISFPPVGLSEEGPLVEVRVSTANITRNENGRTFVVGTVSETTRLWALETNGEFYRVVDPSSLATGWIWSEHATPVKYSENDNETAASSNKASGEMLAALKANDYVLAIRAGRRALRLAEKVWHEEHPNTANVIYNLGSSYMWATDYPNAKVQLERALTIQKRIFGADHPRALLTLRQLGTVYGLLANFEAAEKALVSVVELSRSSKTIDRSSLAAALNELGFFYVNSGMKYGAAEIMFHESLKIRQAALGEESVAAAQSMNNIAWAYLRQGKYNAARPLFQRALEINRNALQADNYVIATNLINLAKVCDGLLEHGNARPLYEEAVAIAEKSLGPDHLRTSDALSSLASNHIVVGSYDLAEPLARRALSIEEKKLGPKHPRVASALATLGAIYLRQGAYDKAELLLKKSLKLKEEIYGPNHSSMISPHFELGRYYFRKADYTNARHSFERSLQIATANKGDSPAYLLSALGATFAALGDLEKGIELTRNAVAIHSKKLGKRDIRTLAEARVLSILSAHGGDVVTAVQLQDDFQRGMRKHLVQILPTMAEHSRNSYLRKVFKLRLHSGLSLAHLDRDNRRTATISAAWLLNGKSMGQEVSAEAALLAAPEAVEQVKELQDVRSQLAKLTIQKAGQVGLITRQKLATLEATQQELQQQISTHGLGISGADPWITTGQLMGEIPYTSAFINIAKVRKYNFDKIKAVSEDQFGASIYVAWIIPSAGAGEVRIVDLGDAFTIDQHVATLRTKLDTTFLTSLADNGEAKSEQDYIEHANALSALIFAPLEPHLGDVRELILSPDSELWTVPWQALRTRNDKYVIEEFETRYVLSGRELVYHLPERGLIGPPVIFADPSYNMPSSRVIANKTHNRHLLRSPSKMQFPRLRQTAIEAMAIKPQIESFANSPASVLMQDEAQEATFKNLHRPQVLVLSTHGFFQSVEPDSTDGSEETTPGIANALLRCGLALAGCNGRNASSDKEDGILTGLEIVGTDLRGTELVVLSACETGLGDICNGDGVAGLRQAFQLAGAKTVISSLWHVEDGETARLMKDLFAGLANGASKSEALRQAQLARIKARRERHGAAHPFFWAAFTLTGRD